MADRKQFFGDITPDPELAKLLKDAAKTTVTEDDLVVLVSFGAASDRPTSGLISIAPLFTYLKRGVMTRIGKRA